MDIFLLNAGLLFPGLNISPHFVDCCAFSAVFRFIDVNRKRTTIDNVR